MKHKIGVIIGRFQPIHNAHEKLIREAMSQCGTVVVLVGSCNRARTFKNPLNFREREHLIRNTINNGDQPDDCNLIILPINDYPYNDAAWVAGIHNAVQEVVDSLSFKNVKPEISVFGHNKDDSSYYLRLFPSWTLTEVPSYGDISATDIREMAYSSYEIPDTNPLVRDWFMNFVKSEEGDRLVDEYRFIREYRRKFNDILPYPPTFVTTDAVVYYKGYVLMVRRRGYPGKGQWALPGGFVEENLRIKDSMIKEIKEETSIRVASQILFGNLRKIETFDDPERSLRGRTITHCGLIVLDPVTSIHTLPKVKGGDDASFAAWISLNEIESMKNNIFEDHYFMIKQMLNMS